MKKFIVTLSRKIHEEIEVPVAAETEQEAKMKALDLNADENEVVRMLWTDFAYQEIMETRAECADEADDDQEVIA